jgi:hypothetical protein
MKFSAEFPMHHENCSVGVNCKTNEGESSRILFCVSTRGRKFLSANGKFQKSEIEMIQVSKEIAVSTVSGFCLDAFYPH